MTGIKPILPKTAGEWKRPDSPQIVNVKNIFDYMNGAGELYIGYCFDHLEVYLYESSSQKNILVELYYMNTSDDAFGLLSLDWGGEPTDLSQYSQKKPESINSSWPQALYGEGLLRLWSDDLYARIMAYQETPASREAVLTLGRALIQNRKNPPRPELWESLSGSFPPDWTLCKDRASYFRSHLVLNSIYYLGQENMLDLIHSTEAVFAQYQKMESSEKQKSIKFLKVRYPDPVNAKAALVHFHKTYLPEHPLPTESDSQGKIVKTIQIEDGWMGYKLQANVMTLAFECPDQETARTIIDKTG